MSAIFPLREIDDILHLEKSAFNYSIVCESDNVG